MRQLYHCNVMLRQQIVFLFKARRSALRILGIGSRHETRPLPIATMVADIRQHQGSVHFQVESPHSRGCHRERIQQPLLKLADGGADDGSAEPSMEPINGPADDDVTAEGRQRRRRKRRSKRRRRRRPPSCSRWWSTTTTSPSTWTRRALHFIGVAGGMKAVRCPCVRQWRRRC